MRFIYLLGSGNVVLIIQPAQEWRCWTFSWLAWRRVCCSMVWSSLCQRSVLCMEGRQPSQGKEKTAGARTVLLSQTLTILHLDIYIYQEHNVLRPMFLMGWWLLVIWRVKDTGQPQISESTLSQQSSPLLFWGEMLHLTGESSSLKLPHAVSSVCAGHLFQKWGMLIIKD